MNILAVVSTTLLVLTSGTLLRLFLKKYNVGFYYIDKQEQEEYESYLDQAFLDYQNSMDLRGTPTHECICGSYIWNVKAIFEDYQIATYFLDMECVKCGSVATAPTPIDRGSNEL